MESCFLVGFLLQTLLKYAEDEEEGKSLLKSLSDKSLNITVFVPHNGGFSVNEVIINISQK